MKKLTILIFIVFSSIICENSYSQTITNPRDFPDSNFTWNESYDEIAYEFNTYFTYRITYYDGGDTLINNLHYRKLFMIKVYVDYDWRDTWPYSPYVVETRNYHELFGLIRNDKANKKVYFMYPDFDEEYVLFDFGLRRKDTVTMNYFPAFANEPHYIVRVDSVVDPYGITRKYYMFSNDLADTTLINGGGWKSAFVEGIGFSNGIYTGKTYVPFEYVFIQLDCIKPDSSKILTVSHYNYLNDPIYINKLDSCNKTKFQFMGVSNEKSRSIKIYPNPTEEQIHFLVDDKIEHVEIYDSRMNLIISKENISSQFIDVSVLPSGIYFTKISTKNNFYTSKFMKK